jgi:hypothetical protein
MAEKKLTEIYCLLEKIVLFMKRYIFGSKFGVVTGLEKREVKS